jgi:hypothetical protein
MTTATPTKITPMQTVTCDTCRFWRADPTGEYGLCMRNPPKVFMGWVMAPSLVDPNRQEVKWFDNTGFPNTGKIAWCGEHRFKGLDERMN